MSVYLQVRYNGKDILCDVTQLSLNYPLLGDFITGNLTRGQQVALPCYLCIEEKKNSSSNTALSCCHCRYKAECCLAAQIIQVYFTTVSHLIRSFKRDVVFIQVEQNSPVCLHIKYIQEHCIYASRIIEASDNTHHSELY